MKDNRKVSWLSYFKKEKKLLILTAITGIIYNVGMIAGPLFEGQLAQYLFDILNGRRAARDIISLSVLYVIVIAAVQGARALKRLYVRRFANNVTRSMKESIFNHLVHEPYAQVLSEDAGAVMTRAIADAEACAEGMRKFTTEIFDTGVVMIAYLVMLLRYDWRLALISLIFPPIAYIVSAAMKKKVVESTAASRKAMSRLNDSAVDLASHALTYRIYGEDPNRERAYEDSLREYEQKNVAAGIWQNSPQPVYFVISMISVIPILYFGGRNVLGTGWKMWTIASFSTFLSCFTKLATKSSHAAKLFNAVQKAEVSWKRIEPYLTDEETEETCQVAAPARLSVENVSFSYEADETQTEGAGAAQPQQRHENISSAAAESPGRHAKKEAAFSLHDLNLTADPGQIIGITGVVASGKSTFGKMFLNEYPYHGHIRYGGREIADTKDLIFAWAGHDPELFTGTVRENVMFSEGPQRAPEADAVSQKISAEDDAAESRLYEVLREVQIDREVTPDTMVGMEGSQLSGGQQARIALARALYSKAPVLILDDPFAAVDADTEKKIFRALRAKESWRTILLISHRMALFPQMDRIVFLENGTMESGSHGEMLQNRQYEQLYTLQETEQR